MNHQTSPKTSELPGARTAPRSRALLVAYLVHLLIPLIFFADSLWAALQGEAGTVEKAVIILGGTWVVLGALGLLLARDKERFLRRAAGPLVTFYTVLICLVLAEFGVRVGIPHFNKAPLLLQPGSKTVTDLSRSGLIGVSPTITFSVNALGLRGPMPPATGRVYKIIAVGGSTTECAALDDTQEWPHLLMELMNSRQKKCFVWVNNAGVSALTTVDHISCLRRLPVLSRVDLLIFLVGVNDLTATLEYGGAPTEKVLERRAQLFAEHAPWGLLEAGGFFRRFWLYPITRTAVLNAVSKFKQLRRSEPLRSEQAERRSLGSILPLPDLRIGLQEYRQRLLTLEHECRARRLRCVFLTQPSMWRANLPPDEQQLLWFGRIGRRGKVLGYAAAGDLACAMDAYNQTLLSLCRQDHLECYDLASAIPKNTSAFYDDVHFNIGGGRLVAEFVAEHLLAAAPFADGSVYVVDHGSNLYSFGLKP